MSKKEDNSDRLNLDEIDDLTDFDEAVSEIDNEDRSKKSKKSRKGMMLFIAVATVLILLVILGLSASGNDKENDGSQEKKTVELQLVNSQQVNYAQKMCTLLPEWKKNMVPLSGIKSQSSPVKIRNAIIKSLEKNAAVLNKESRGLSQVPSQVYTKSKKDSKDITVKDNVLKVGDKPDEKVSQSAQYLSTTMSGYAESIKTMADDLKKIAPYNDPGIRSSIDDITHSFGSLNSQFAKDVSSSINDNMFDNTMTMQKVSEISECNGAFINPDSLKQQKGDEIEKQNIIRSYALQDRCRGFLASVQSVPENNRSERIKNDESTCKEIVASGTDFSKDPYIQSVNIDLGNENNREKVTLDKE